MLAWFGLFTIVLVLAAIISKKMSAMGALILIPIVMALLAGFSLSEVSGHAVTGIRAIAPVIGMFVFAILFFSILTDAGMFDPIIDWILKTVGHQPARIALGTTVLAVVAHLDGSGATTFLVVVPAMLPLYQRLGMDRRILACCVAMGAGVANMLPWGGPTLRAASALQVDVMALFLPVLPVMLAGLLFACACAWLMGRREAKRLMGGEALMLGLGSNDRDLSAAERGLRRPKLVWLNLGLVLLVLGSMLMGWAEPVLCFMLGAVVALWLNYPKQSDQKARIDAHAGSVMMMAGILFAAGVFTGILKNAGMLSAMAETLSANAPAQMAGHFPFILGLVSMPLSMVFDPDSFYFGILPVVSAAAHDLGVPALQMGQAALLGQMTTGFPISPLTPATFLLVGLAGVDLAEHQRFSFLYLWAISIVMTLVSVLLGVFPF
ncbi:MAG: hypothetical protein KBC57_04375 [Neisseriaceae bacterium]|nr:hypothetical protein [Neisseriaceae bacterium]MBP6861576.1 hypothetical protein [Neisseriaceae bacterium]